MTWVQSYFQFLLYSIKKISIVKLLARKPSDWLNNIERPIRELGISKANFFLNMSGPCFIANLTEVFAELSKTQIKNWCQNEPQSVNKFSVTSLFFNFWSFTSMQSCPKAYKISQSILRLCKKLNKTSKNCPSL